MNRNSHSGIFPGIYHWDDNEPDNSGLDHAALSYLTNNVTFDDVIPDKESAMLIQASGESTHNTNFNSRSHYQHNNSHQQLESHHHHQSNLHHQQHNDSSLNSETLNSDDCLNIAAEAGSISFMKGGSKGSKKNVDKGTEEYKKRRERNNVAVRKSREKAKQRSRDTEKKVVELQTENVSLRRKVDELSDQMIILRRLLDNVGVSQESIDCEIACSSTTTTTSSSSSSSSKPSSSIFHPLLNLHKHQ